MKKISTLKFCITIFYTMSLISCVTTANKFGSVQEGMSMHEVKNMVGEPKEKELREGKEYWHYDIYGVGENRARYIAFLPRASARIAIIDLVSDSDKSSYVVENFRREFMKILEKKFYFAPVASDEISLVTAIVFPNVEKIGKATVQEIGNRLSADYLVFGNVRNKNNDTLLRLYVFDPVARTYRDTDWQKISNDEKKFQVEFKEIADRVVLMIDDMHSSHLLKKEVTAKVDHLDRKVLVSNYQTVAEIGDDEKRQERLDERNKKFASSVSINKNNDSKNNNQSSNSNSDRAIDDDVVNELAAELKTASFSSKQVDLFDKYSRRYYFRCYQLARLLKVISFENSRLDALRKVGHRVVDLANAETVVQAFTFSSNQRDAKQILGVE